MGDQRVLGQLPVGFALAAILRKERPRLPAIKYVAAAVLPAPVVVVVLSRTRTGKRTCCVPTPRLQGAPVTRAALPQGARNGWVQRAQQATTSGSRGPPSYSQRGWIGGSPPIFHPSWRPLPLTGGGQGIRVGTDAVSGHSKPRTLRRYLGWEKLSATLAKGGRVHLPLFRRSSNVYVSRFRYTRKM